MGPTNIEVDTRVPFSGGDMICTNRKKLGKDVGFRFGERHVYIYIFLGIMICFFDFEKHDRDNII